jgi:hypothetical protein
MRASVAYSAARTMTKVIEKTREDSMNLINLIVIYLLGII